MLIPFKDVEGAADNQAHSLHVVVSLRRLLYSPVDRSVLQDNLPLLHYDAVTLEN